MAICSVAFWRSNLPGYSFCLHFSFAFWESSTVILFQSKQSAQPYWKASISSRRDVHISVLSYLLEAISEFCIGLSQTGIQVIVCKYNKRHNDMYIV